jgi:hypothetical protein
MKPLSDASFARWIKFSGILEMGFGVLFLSVMPAVFSMVGIPSEIPFGLHAFGMCVFALGLTLYASHRNPKEMAVVPIISCLMRFGMVGVELYSAFLLFGFTENSIYIAYALVCGATYDFISTAYTLWVMKQKTLF